MHRDCCTCTKYHAPKNRVRLIGEAISAICDPLRHGNRHDHQLVSDRPLQAWHDPVRERQPRGQAQARSVHVDDRPDCRDRRLHPRRRPSPSQRSRIWSLTYDGAQPQKCAISDIGSEANRGLIGRSIAAAAACRGEDPLDTFLGLIDEEWNAVSVVAHNRTEGDMRTFLGHPAAMIGSDGTAISPTGSHGRPQLPHPRYYGTFPRVLGRYVRDEPVLDLADAVRKMAGLPAERVGLRDRGRIRG